MHRYLIMLVIAATALVAAASGVAGATPDDDLRAGLEADLATDPAIPGEIVAVRAPGLRTAVAAGLADRASGTPLEPDTPFRVASMTKTFVAAAVLRLVEEGDLRLNDPIADHLSEESLAQLRGDGYDPDRITVRQLLQHTSGLYDYATDPDYEAALSTDPGHRWTRAEQVQFAMDQGDPLGEPGTVHQYGDTGYVLLGEILERTTSDTLPGAIRQLLDFRDLGLDHTYWEDLEPTPPGTPPRAHQYFGDDDNITLDASADLFGGGGLISTVDDLARFYAALFDGAVFERPRSLRTMTRVPPVSRDEGAGMGIFSFTTNGLRCFGHSGVWGTQTIHCPRLDLTLARTMNQAFDDDFDYDALERVAIDAVRQAKG